MISVEHIKELAELSRINLSDQQIQSYQKDLAGILEYIDTIKSVPITINESETRETLRNVMRDDEISYTPGEFSKVLLEAAPDTEGDFVKVKKIL